MSKSKASADPFKRHKTRGRGITYRVHGGGRTYPVYFEDSYLTVEGDDKEAPAKQAELRGKAARGAMPA